MDLLSLIPNNRPAWFADLQGNILKGHGRDHTLHLLLSFIAGDPQKVRDRIQGFSHQFVTPMSRQLDESEQFKKFGLPGRLFVNFLLSKSGYEKLGFTGAEIPPDRSFQLGMSASQTRNRLADPDPAQWEPGLGSQPIDAMIILADDDPEFLGRQAREILSDYFDGAAATLLGVEKGAAIRNKRGETIEHFGYVDGRSQPVFFEEELAIEKKRGGIANWDPSAPMELVLANDPNSGEQQLLGSYFVFRKLEQNVREFKRTEREKLASTQKFTGEDVELAGAMVVGRFEDGTPVTLQKGDGVDDPVLNNFNYKDDAGASKCPFHAHIRKVNPRNLPQSESDSPFDPGTERSRRIARRGITYGERTADSFETEDFDTLPSGDVGLLFMCFQSNIAEQFEFMQSTWANSAVFPQVDVGIDPVIGQDANAPTPPNPPLMAQSWSTEWGDEDFGDHPKAKFPFGGFVTMKGGEYFFAPSLLFLKNIVVPPKPPQGPPGPETPGEPKPYGGA